jgi:rfaE bifunctional protein kinase chain/domain
MHSLKPKKVLIAGDLMLDLYTMGDVHRISPEAPVPVLRVTQELRRPGGAGNAILNLVSLGMEVVAVGRVGDDPGGHIFLEEMAKEGVDTRGIVCDAAFQTPLKNRVIATNCPNRL